MVYNFKEDASTARLFIYLREKAVSAILIFMEIKKLDGINTSALFLNLLAGLWIVASPWLLNIIGLNETLYVLVAGIIVVVTNIWFMFKAGIFRLKKVVRN